MNFIDGKFVSTTANEIPGPLGSKPENSVSAGSGGGEKLVTSSTPEVGDAKASDSAEAAEYGQQSLISDNEDMTEGKGNRDEEDAVTAVDGVAEGIVNNDESIKSDSGEGHSNDDEKSYDMTAQTGAEDRGAEEGGENAVEHENQEAAVEESREESVAGEVSGQATAVNAGLTISATLVNDDASDLNEEDFKPLAATVIDKLPSLRGNLVESNFLFLS